MLYSLASSPAYELPTNLLTINHLIAMEQESVPHFRVHPGSQPLVFQPVLPTGIRNRGL